MHHNGMLIMLHVLNVILFCREEKQGDEAADNLCFPSHFASVEQESDTNLDGDISSIFITYP